MTEYVLGDAGSVRMTYHVRKIHSSVFNIVIGHILPKYPAVVEHGHYCHDNRSGCLEFQITSPILLVT